MKSLLELCILNKEEDIIRLLKNGCETNDFLLRDDHGMTPLMWLCVHQNKQLFIQMCLSYNYPNDLKIKDNMGNDIFTYTFENGFQQTTLMYYDIMESKLKNINDIWLYRKRLFQRCCIYNNIYLAKEIFKRVSKSTPELKFELYNDIDTVYGSTNFYWFCKNKWIKFAENALNDDSFNNDKNYISHINFQGYTPLLICIENRLFVLSELIWNSGKSNPQVIENKHFEYALMKTIIHCMDSLSNKIFDYTIDNNEILSEEFNESLLLISNIDLDNFIKENDTKYDWILHRNKEGYSLLHFAFLRGNSYIILKLLKIYEEQNWLKSINWNQTFEDDYGYIQMIFMLGYKDIVLYFFEKKIFNYINFSNKFSFYYTFFEYSFSYNWYDIIDLLWDNLPNSLLFNYKFYSYLNYGFYVFFDNYKNKNIKNTDNIKNNYLLWKESLPSKLEEKIHHYCPLSIDLDKELVNYLINPTYNDHIYQNNYENSCKF